MRFRSAKAADAATLTELAYRSKMHWGYSTDFMQAVRHELEITAEQIASGYCEVAETDGRAVGFILLLPAFPQVELEALFVDPTMISNGLGSELVRRALLWVRSQAFTTVETIADPNAVGFYEKHGFTKVGEHSSNSISDRKLPIMQLRVDGF